MGIFSRRMNREGAITGMIGGLAITSYYIARFKLGWIGSPETSTANDWWFGISPEGFGTVGMLVNFAIAIVISRFTSPPPAEVQEIVENIRIPSGAGDAVQH
jgi:cation/acetate symporter